MRVLTVIRQLCEKYQIRRPHDRIYNDKNKNKDGYSVRFAIEYHCHSVPEANLKAFADDFLAIFPRALVDADHKLTVHIKLLTPLAVKPMSRLIARDEIVVNADGTWEHTLSFNGTPTETTRIYRIALIKQLQENHYEQFRPGRYRKIYQVPELKDES